MDVNTEMPVPRRSMSQPLKQQVIAEAPMAAATPVAAEAVEFEAEETTPSFFEELNVEEVAAQDMAEDIFAEDAGGEADDLPAPAYIPQVAPREQPRASFEPDAADRFVAPRAPVPGTPSPEAMARLRAAAQKAVPTQARTAPQPVQAGERPRFGINSLINRMTGHEQQGQPERPARQQPPVQTQASAAAPQPRETPDTDQERIEIPAFLRRQAN